jgi:extradiol dioxygenase family protein
MKEIPPFHLAFPVKDLTATKDFYLNLLGCRMGRSSERWIDFDLFGHQVVAHRVSPEKKIGAADYSEVDNHPVPVPHFGVVLDWETWQQLAARLKEHQISFVIEPYIRFAGQAGEQATMFFLDPSGNALEFKAFRDPGQLFVS